MAETQVATTGWGGEVWLHNGTALYELLEVTDFTPPGIKMGRTDASHLKVAGRRKKNINTLYDTATCTVTLNWRPGSTTDLLLRAAAQAADERAAKFVIPEDGEPNVDIEPDGVVCIGYEPNGVELEGVLQIEATFEIVGGFDQTASA